MKTINIYKAQPVIKSEPVTSVTIVIDREVPSGSDLEEWRQIIDKEASELCTVLCDTLPQGVTDALLGKLLARKASLFVVPMPKEKSK